MTYDVIVIGGGPSGLMAAIAAAEQGAKTLLLEKGKRLGRKLAISGGGRCNVTNRLPREEIIRHIPGNGKFLYSAFYTFDNEDIIAFFEGLGVKLKEEDHGRMFPANDSAQSVVNTLVRQLKNLKVDLRLEEKVVDLSYGDEYHQVILKSGERFRTRAIVVAVGGKSVPHTGSTGDGYRWAQKAGHRITPLYPTEVPLTSKESFIKKQVLKGLSLRDVGLSVLDAKGKKIITHKMDMIFTHFGLSGPAVLRCSQFVVKELRKGRKEVEMEIDLFPDHSLSQVEKMLRDLFSKNERKTVKNVLKTLAPERYISFLLQELGIGFEKKLANLSKQDFHLLLQALKGFRFHVHGSLSLEKAFVTGGGVDVKEIEPATMESKLQERLFFCGEILDIHGYTGGYNITSALVTGRIAGLYANMNKGS